MNRGQWRNLTVDDGLAGNIVYSMTQDKAGNYWFGTNNGISRFDGDSWQTIGLEHGLPSKDVYTLVVDGQGSIWAGVRGSVVEVAKK